MTVNEMCARTGVSARTLHHYDRIGLLPPARVTEAGYRLYDEASLERLQLILLFRELEFPLKDIKRILDSGDFDRNRALERQIALLEMKKEHIDNLIMMAKGMRLMGTNRLDYGAFDVKKFDEYEREARANWGKTPAFQEYEEKSKGRAAADNRRLEVEMMAIFAEFGALRDGDPASDEALALVKKLRDFINDHFYTCTDEILRGLGRMYGGGGSMTENIDHAGGPGTGAFAERAIEAFCGGGKE